MQEILVGNGMSIMLILYLNQPRQDVYVNNVYLKPVDLHGNKYVQDRIDNLIEKRKAIQRFSLVENNQHIIAFKQRIIKYHCLR